MTHKEYKEWETEYIANHAKHNREGSLKFILKRTHKIFIDRRIDATKDSIKETLIPGNTSFKKEIEKNQFIDKNWNNKFKYLSQQSDLFIYELFKKYKDCATNHTLLNALSLIEEFENPK